MPKACLTAISPRRMDRGSEGPPPEEPRSGLTAAGQRAIIDRGIASGFSIGKD